MSEQMTDLRLSSQTATRMAARELMIFATRLEQLEHGVEHICDEIDGTPRGEAVVALQEIDILLQSALALSNYLDKIAATLPEDDTIDVVAALSAVPLRGLAARLSGGVNSDRKSGQPEVF